jgi:Ni,Fe-hydrogenase III component G
MNVKDYEQDFRDAFQGAEVQKIRPHRYLITVKNEELISSVKTLKERFGMTHLSTIVAEDLRDSFQLTYLFASDVVAGIRTKIPRDDPKISSIFQIIEGSEVYENEVHDLFGIVFEGHPNPRRTVLPDDWPEGLYPLRKDVTL